mmetsp:Transcript_38959/g.63701  ORF Transcript_38959/g.63701 Transcript_38959/m.63701 type:complete len:171 (+) Transcript_38959:230-742(+)|eukprot:CAMPEP_0202690220 /NCGR_PEP_ID=MMETSP1385-20130828/5275_1 /ASSEMBLY_ACC=CAM_ASM_000861 /TAXON_ID=933848 /ORGANISM="Elphidium margaritaceum" /LENGTH=170 /DNA_ID=CAMNT_0049345455 /DNA_START=126 /DNA_END=638 /DNA_ORIENTATION=-
MPGKPEKRLRRELERISKDQVPGCAARLRGSNIFEWEAFIEGPKDSPYEGGTFHLFMNFPTNYPIKPPSVTVKTKVYHPNIADNGSICLDILKGNWSPVLTVQKVLLSIVSLLTDPNADDPLVGSVARVYKTDRAKYTSTCKKWTRDFAMNKTHQKTMKKILELKDSKQK